MLRSGEYNQTRNHLRTEDGYCCLGVLCELAVAEGIIPSPRQSERVYYYLDESEILPKPVADWAGLTTMNGDMDVRFPDVTGGCLSGIGRLLLRFCRSLFRCHLNPEGLFKE